MWRVRSTKLYKLSRKLLNADEHIAAADAMIAEVVESFEAQEALAVA